eukprot:1161623-Pelagomonas_calceolata.AAC.5
MGLETKILIRMGAVQPRVHMVSTVKWGRLACDGCIKSTAQHSIASRHPVQELISEQAIQ